MATHTTRRGFLIGLSTAAAAVPSLADAAGPGGGGQGVTKLLIGEVVRIEPLWNRGDGNLGEGGDAAAEPSGGVCTGWVPVEQENDTRGGVEKTLLWLGEMEAEQSDGGHIDLVESHDAPGTLGQNEGGGREPKADSVEVEQDLIAWKPRREFPFSEACGELRVQASAGVAEGRAFWVV